MSDKMLMFTSFDVDTYSMVAWGEDYAKMQVYWPVLRNHGNRLQYDQRIKLKDFTSKNPNVHVPPTQFKRKADIIKKYGDVVYDRSFDRV